MKKWLLTLLIVFFSLLIQSCASDGREKNEKGFDSLVLGEHDLEEEVNLTCYAHNDNEYYEAWNFLVYDYDGAFNYYNNFYPLKTNNRITIKATKGVYCEISLLNEYGEVVYTNIPDANGLCYLFPTWYANTYKISVKYYQNSDLEPITAEYTIGREYKLHLPSVSIPKEVIDLMFVVDTTVSMGDELDYLKNEISDVIERVSSFNDCIVNVAVLLYKDKGEIYETLYSEFTTNVDEQLNFLNDQIAYGGGDYEEAVDVAIEEAFNKSWSLSNSTKILVHIGDAPAHDENINDWYNSVLKLCSKGIRIITIASSGINKKTEYLFRSMTLISNGTYVAVTNDSGVGEDHMDPSTEVELTIEYLDNCLVRLINGYHTGVLYDPVPIK